MWPWLTNILNRSNNSNNQNNIFLPDDDDSEALNELQIPDYIQHYVAYLDHIENSQNSVSQSDDQLQNQDLSSFEQQFPFQYTNQIITLDPSIYNKFMDYLLFNSITSSHAFDLTQPTLTLYLSNQTIANDQAYFQKFIIQKQGCQNSQKNSTCQDITIGSAVSIKTDQGIIRPNDIELQDSRLPAFICKIITKYGFYESKEFNYEYLLFIKANYRRLPVRVINLIWQFANPYGYFYLEYFTDSQCGAYQLSFQTPHFIRKGDIYLLGFKVRLSIIEIATNKNLNWHKNPFTKKEANQMLIRETRQKNITVVGYEIERENFFGYKPYTFQCICALQLPVIQVEFEFVDNKKKFRYLIFARDTPYIIGRGFESIININAPEISRSQTQIWYNQEEEQWCIRDGYDYLPSVNGSWKCFKNLYNEKPEKIVLENNMQFKVEGGCFMVQLPEKQDNDERIHERKKKIIENMKRLL